MLQRLAHQKAPTGRTPARAGSWVFKIAGPSPGLRWCCHHVNWKAARLAPCLSAPAATRSDSAVFRHPGELDLNLREYMVVLEKPVGLTLAPDPKTGQVVVQAIRPHSPAHKCGLIQVGDVVKACSAVFGDDMWPAGDIRRVRWAINSRCGDVKLVLERLARGPGGRGGGGGGGGGGAGGGGAPLTAWYCGGKAGVATRERDGMQLPYSFNSTTINPDDSGSFLELPGAGRTMQVAFHRNTGASSAPPATRRAAAAAAARAAVLGRLRRELSEARGMTPLDLGRSSVNHRPGGPDSFVLPPAPPAATTTSPSSLAAPGSGSRPGAGGAGAGASSPASARGAPGGGGGGGGGPPPPPPVVDVVAAPPPPSFSSENGNNGSSNGSNNGNGGLGLLSGLKLGGGGGGSNNSGAAAAAAAGAAAAPPPAGSGSTAGGGGAAAAKERRVITFLPWLLVACGGGRLEHRHIASIASQRSLGSLLELSLTRAGAGAGAQPQPQPAPAQQPTATTTPAASSSSSAAEASSSSSSNNGNSNSSSSNGSSGSSGSSGSASAKGVTGGSGGGGGGGYLVVRGSDLVPLASDVGRVSYQALAAAAAAAASPNGGASGSGGGSTNGASGAGAAPQPQPPPSPIGELPPPPPPGSAAATAAMINGADVVAADGSSLVATSLTGAATVAAVLASAGGNGSTSASGGSLGDGAADAGDGAAVSGNGNGNGNGSGSGLGSSTMAFLNRSIFLNLRPSMPFASSSPASSATAAAAKSPPSSSLPPSSSASSSPASASSASASRPPTFSSLPHPSRYDPLRVRHLLNAAASLQRLAYRRGGRLARSRSRWSRGEACSVLLHCLDEGMEGDVAVLLAGWLHWFGRLPLQEAILVAETAMGVAVDQGLLEAGTSALLQGARERCSRVVLTWKYGGLSAYVAGDVVASWGARVPMVRCRSPLGCKGDTHPGHFFLEVQGLRPGVYYYKYIVDGTWAVDSLSSKVLDSAGNWNNVLVVPEPPLVLTSREGLALARWQAGRLALEAKMGLAGPGGLRPL